MSDSILEIKDITIKLQKNNLIQRVSFSLSSGEIVGLLGPNGAGKSTLMKAIMGILPITEGEIVFLENSLQNKQYTHFEEIGALIEIPTFYPHLSGWVNLKILSRMNKRHISTENLNKTVSLLKMEQFIHQKVHTYSLGMKQRLGIAQALMHNPRLLLLDEPLNGLDTYGILEMRLLLKELAEKNITILISSHQLLELEKVADRFLLINKGKIIDTQTKEEITSSVKLLNLKTSDNSVAYTVLEQAGYTVTYANEIIKVELIEDSLNNCLELLLENHLQIYSVDRSNFDLESYFLQKCPT